MYHWVWGTFSGTEKFFRSEFCKLHPDAVQNGLVGFMGPGDAPKSPTYKEVCTGETGHVEVYKFEYVGGAKMYEELVRYFFQFHDPCQYNKQGNDKGTQYASVIFCYDEQQLAIARNVIYELQDHLDSGRLPKKTYTAGKVKTDVRLTKNCSPFYAAHDEHQKYLELHPKGYCNHRIRFKMWPESSEEFTPMTTTTST